MNPNILPFNHIFNVPCPYCHGWDVTIHAVDHLTGESLWAARGEEPDPDTADDAETEVSVTLECRCGKRFGVSITQTHGSVDLIAPA